MKRTQQGFTLVEIAIVLVIIGLLLGGILKGQEMIAQAKIKNVIGDMAGISAAMYGYQDRYRALPGDDKGAATRWATVAGILPGDGDGVVAGKYLATAGESVQFWLHLRSAGFIAGTGLDHPFNAVSGKMGVQTGDGNYTAGPPAVPVGAVLNTVGPPAITGFTGLILCSANLPDKVAISVDAQTDDGNSLSGSVRGLTQAGQPNIPVVGAATAYVEDGVSSYVVCRTLI